MMGRWIKRIKGGERKRKEKGRWIKRIKKRERKEDE
jgi:hypothetical protein